MRKSTPESIKRRDARVSEMSSIEWRIALLERTIRPASLDDVWGTHHQRPLYKHPNTGQWYTTTKESSE